MARETKQQQRRRQLLRRVLGVLGLAGVVALAVLGWRWQASVPVAAVEVHGAVHADTTEIVALAAVPDSSMLFALDPALLEDRVRRHPWVADASVTRWATGTLGISVRERVPVAIALDAAGRPDYYFDAAGFRMPVASAVAGRAVYDVPLLHGFGPYQPTTPVDDASVLDLLAALAGLDEATDALVSSVERTPGGFVLTTSPSPGGAAIPVALGRSGFAEKLDRLHAFWQQAVLTRPDTPVRRIDLRFDGQIVTLE